jgi:hypothetical protein
VKTSAIGYWNVKTLYIKEPMINKPLPETQPLPRASGFAEG